MNCSPLTHAIALGAGLAAFGLSSTGTTAEATTNSLTNSAAFARRQTSHPAHAAEADYQRMLNSLHVQLPSSLPPPADDPKRPPNTRPQPGASASWTDGVPGHTIVRSGWGHWSNHDEAKAGLYPLPDPLRLKNGQLVTNEVIWWSLRRPEILEDFQREIFGRIPTNTPKVTWTVVSVDTNGAAGKAIVKRLSGSVDNSGYPQIKLNLDLMVYLPAKAAGPVPVIMIGGFAFRRSGPGSGAALGATGSQSSAPAPIAGASPRIIELLLENGFGYAVLDTLSVQPDNAAGLTHGIIGLLNRGQPRKPDDWGTLAAWAWGLSRALDYLQTDPAVDAKKVGLEGHSRWGKEALVAMAFDPRFAILYASCSGEGGAKLHRHDIGESVDELCGPREYHWMAGNFLKYAGHWNDLPVDAHELIALAAPRPIFITGGTQDLWADPVGEFKACVAAGPVYRLLGKKDLGTTKMPEPDAELISGDIAYREHRGGHTDAPDWPTFIKFAKKYFGQTD